MNKKILAVAIAGALAAPSAFAATDTSGMQYTSASEGFYASIRLRFLSAKNGHDNSGADIENASSRIGVRGSNDLGGGLSGFYQWELGVNTENSASAGSTRIGHVGLRGGFGEVLVGSGWTAHYNMTHGSTDVANTHSGNLNYTALLPGRASKMIQYTTPDLNGFQAAVAVRMSNSGAASTTNGVIHPEIPATYQYRRVVNAALADEAAGRYGTAAANNLTRWSDTPGDAPGTVTNRAAANNGTNGAYFNPADSSEPVVKAPSRVGAADGDGQLFIDINEVDAAANRTIVNGDYEVRLRPGSPAPAAAVMGTTGKDENDIDTYMFTAQYVVQGFSAAIGYVNQVESFYKGRTTDREDATSLVYKLGYAQDNWYVNGWYATDNSSDRGTGYEDSEMLSLAGGVEVGKVNLYAIYEAQETQLGATTAAKEEDEFTTVGVQYNLGARSRVWVEYAGRDQDSNTANGDFINIGLRHDF